MSEEPSVEALLKELEQRGINLWAEGDRLKFDAPVGALTPDLRTRLKALKPLLLKRLTARPERIPLTPAQERLWFIGRLAGFQPAAYNMPTVWRLEGHLNRDDLTLAFGALIQRHEILRTRFPAINDRPYQDIHPFGGDQSEWLPLDHLPANERETALDRLLQARMAQPFDLERGPLLRRHLFRLDNRTHVLLVVFHHIIADGWSLRIFGRELAALYRGEALPALPLQFADYAIHPPTQDQGLAFWRDALADRPGLLELPFDRPRPDVPAYAGAAVHFQLDMEETSELRGLADDTRVTLFMLLQTGLALLLGRVAGSRDVIIATPVANRPQARLEGLIGLFINTVLLRNDLSGNPTVRTLLKRCAATITDALEHAATPYDRVVRVTRPADTDVPPFQVLFVLQNTPVVSPELTGLRVEGLPLKTSGSRCDLTLSMTETRAGLTGHWEYDSELFDRDTVQGLVAAYRHVLAQMAVRPHQTVEQLSLMDTARRQQLLNTLQTPVHPLNPKGLWPMFAAWADRDGKRIALQAGGLSVGYGDLKMQALRTAADLAEHGVGPGGLVALCGPRSPQTLAALLGILAAGACWLPLDPSQPQNRLQDLLERAHVDLLLAPPDCLPNHNGPRLWASTGKTARAVVPPPAAPAYVIYTSGSTGRPKGVVITHGVLVNLIQHVDSGNAACRTLQFTSLGFDVAAQEIFSTLCGGGTLVLVDDHTRRDPLGLADLIEAQRVQRIFMPNTALQQLAEAAGERLQLETIVTAGEPLHLTPAVRALAASPTRLLNHYGPSETHVITSHLVDVTREHPLPSIGLPVAGCGAFVLDQNLEPVPAGVVGELYLTGVGLGMGYHRDAASTALKFIPNPFGAGEGERLYRCGDLARFHRGRLHFLGRVDHQLKLRGYRIEPGEIEAVLEHHSQVLEAVVKLDSSAAFPRLIAFVVAPSGEPHDLRAYAAQRLPAYMVPARFEFCREFPKTGSGKVDRRALAPTAETRVRAIKPVPGDVLETVCAVWRDVLELEKLDPNANFFDLGGHSLLMVPLINQINTALGTDLRVLDLFSHPSADALAEKIGGVEISSPLPASNRQNQAEDIAVIGLACRLPGAPDNASFWEFLCQGRSGITRFSPEELAAAGVPASVTADPNYVPVGTRLNHYDCFDAAFFGISPREAAGTDPQHRLFLEEAWHALEDAGYAGTVSHVGVFGGVDLNRYLLRHYATDPATLEPMGVVGALIGNDKDYLTTRVSYKLNLTGPSLDVQTACSTSLSAVHLACHSLRRGECDLALAGGAALQVPQGAGYRYQPGSILSPDGFCRPFDVRATGTVPASGVGVVALKPLADARADHDHIYAVIVGSAVNNDGGRKVGYTAPAVSGQSAVITTALREAQVRPNQIRYLEAHGTATELGDPVEWEALTNVFESATTNIALGSLKSNMGHLGAAAGVAGLIKVCLMLKHRTLVPSLHYQTPNPNLGPGPFSVQTTTQNLSGKEPLFAGVSSFGIGGTNVHVVLQSPPPSAETPTEGSSLLLLSAKSARSLREAAANLADFLEREPASLVDVAFSLARGRAGLIHRLAVTAVDCDEAVQRLRDGCVGVEPYSTRGVVFLLPGQGAEPADSWTFYQGDPTFERWIDTCAEVLARDGFDLIAALQHSDPEADTDVVQPRQFAVSYAWAQWWHSRGVEPVALLGHSLGQITAACLAGIFSLEDGLKLVLARGRAMAQTPHGAMAAFPLSEAEIRPLLGDDLELAGVNSPRSCVLAGDHNALEAAAVRMKIKPIFLKTRHAFHSQAMAAAIPAFRTALAQCRFHPPRIPVMSNPDGAVLTPDQAVDPAYWERHLLSPVRFADGLKTALEYGDVLLEMGTERALSGLVRRQTEPCSIVTPLAHTSKALQETLGRLWTLGAPIQMDRVFTMGRRIPLPCYPFEKTRHWIDALSPGRQATQPSVTAAELEREPALVAAMTKREREKRTGPMMEQICAEMTAQILEGMGVDFEPGESFTTPALSLQLGVAADRVRQLDTLLHILRHVGVLDKAAGPWDTALWRVQKRPQINRPEQRARRLAEAHPNLERAVKMLLDCGAAMPQILRGQLDIVQVLFPGGDAARIGDLYRDLPLQQVMNGLIARALQAAVADADPAQPARILEIGAGTGATTEGVLPHLPADRVRYTFTDLSPFFTVKAKETFAAYPFMDYHVYNAEQDPAEQGLTTGVYRVVTASNVIHATRDLRESLSHALSLLEPGGMLVLLEGTGRSHFADLVFGGLSGWNRFTDFDVRTSLCPALQTWLDLLREVGFEDVVSVPGRETESNRGTVVLLARRPLDHVQPTRVIQTNEDTLSPPQGRMEGELCDVMAALFGVERVGRDADFFQMGGDSLVAIQLSARLKDLYGRRVSSKDLVDHPTPAALAQFLELRPDKAEPDLLLHLGGEGARLPWFLIAGGGGCALYFHEPAKILAKDGPVYGIEYMPGDRDHLGLHTLPDLACYLVQQIQRVQPQGPYRLAGHSMGGWLAHQITLALERAGETVERLVILDIHAYGTRFERERVDRSREWAAFQGRLQARGDADLLQAEPIAALEEGLNLEDFQPKVRVQARIDLIRAVDGTPRGRAGAIPEFQDDPTQGWSQLCSGVRVVEVPGDHYSMFNSPNAEALARQLAFPT